MASRRKSRQDTPSVGFVAKIPVGIPQVLWPRGFAVKISVAYACVQVLWLRGENPGRIAEVTECCGFVVKIPVGIPQVLWLRGENPGRIPQVLALWRRSRLGYLKFCGFAVRSPVGDRRCCDFVVKIPVGIPQVLWLLSENPGRIHPVFAASLCRSRLG